MKMFPTAALPHGEKQGHGQKIVNVSLRKNVTSRGCIAEMVTQNNEQENQLQSISVHIFTRGKTFLGSTRGKFLSFLRKLWKMYLRKKLCKEEHDHT